ncbi:Patatin-like phospholipase [Rhizobiales bacterium GAS188]|nr:Patatin-like phospholipase [Rhizobiales bacterium GAS188]
MGIKKFDEIFQSEIEAINKRRNNNERSPIALEEEDRQRDGTPVLRPTSESRLIGLALSGGGIRSAAFGLGALQALDVRGIIKKVDYLSTVSGGGYIGTSMTAAMTAATSVGDKEKFPFASELRTGEVAAVQHIRDHSNYLFPQGALNLFGNVVVYLRGILANAVLLLPWLTFAAALTILWNPDVKALAQNENLAFLPIAARPFAATLNLLLLFVIVLVLWALWRSTRVGRNFSDVGLGARLFGAFLVIIMLAVFLELQPWLLAGMFKVAHSPNTLAGAFSTASSWLKGLTAFFASIGTVVGVFSRSLVDALKRSTEKPGVTASVMALSIRLAMYVAGAGVPMVLWVAYLYLVFWGIPDCDAGKCIDHAPHWLSTLAGWLPFGDGSIRNFYLVVFVVLALVGWCLSANANSLHRLYRDRLSKAFLFDPSKRVAPNGKAGEETDADLRNCDLMPLDHLKVSKLRTDLAPYQLINVALNIEASKYANRRDRNADFFMFSPLYTGSESTGYIETELMEAKSPGLNAGTAMAISGAAASSNMGSATVKPLVPTLAILNIRLGYWMKNPAKVAGVLIKPLWAWFFDKLYFLKELLGLLTEYSNTIYLTDGGHIENLGIYELLRRRCKLVIAVDAEADPDMSFGSLVTLERYARIDFSLRIDLPWAALRDTTREASAKVLETGGLPPNKAPHGPHCALGTIYYPRKRGETDDTHSTGVLLYIKSSFTGDENDYIVDYKRRNPDFPHETTLDQLFTEEQFEAYRALGFHAVNSAFKRVDKVSMNPDPVVWQGATTTLPLEKQMLAILA